MTTDNMFQSVDGTWFAKLPDSQQYRVARFGDDYASADPDVDYGGYTGFLCEYIAIQEEILADTTRRHERAPIHRFIADLTDELEYFITS